MLRHLISLRPGANRIEILAHVLSVEVYELLRITTIDPDGAENAGIDGAHEPLANEVEAVCLEWNMSVCVWPGIDFIILWEALTDMPLQDSATFAECLFAFGKVVIVVVV